MSLLRSFVKSFFYLVVLYGYSLSHAGSYEDFFSAIQRDDPAVVSALLARGFDVNTLNPAGESGLLQAVRGESLQVTAVLLKSPQIVVETRSQQDESPLMLASLKGLTEVCQQLITKGADVNKPGWAPLHYAATHGHLPVMRLLLDNYAYIDAASPNGSTPIMMAAHYGTPEAVRLLLDAGADPLLRNVQGMNAIDFAQRAERPAVADLISAFVRARQPKGKW